MRSAEKWRRRLFRISAIETRLLVEVGLVGPAETLRVELIVRLIKHTNSKVDCPGSFPEHEFAANYSNFN